MIEANRLIKDYISKQPHASFINVFDVMMNASHQPKPEIFLDDSLHMNAKGLCDLAESDTAVFGKVAGSE
jgi:hypothetical protein